MARDTLVPIRMNEDEIRTLRAAAERAGLGLGPWLRSLGMREAANQMPAQTAGKPARRVGAAVRKSS